VLFPDDKEIECNIVEKKKHELLSKYMSEDLMEEQVEAKGMLNIYRYGMLMKLMDHHLFFKCSS
jgi:pre-mRNA-splicing factor ISY1